MNFREEKEVPRNDLDEESRMCFLQGGPLEQREEERKAENSMVHYHLWMGH